MQWLWWWKRRKVKEERDLFHQHINALTCIMGFIDMAKDEPDKRKRNQILESAQYAVTRAAELLKKRGELEGMLPKEEPA